MARTLSDLFVPTSPTSPELRLAQAKQRRLTPLTTVAALNGSDRSNP